MAALALVLGLGWTGMHLRGEARAAAKHAVRVAELRGSIAYLDEWMTASARLAAATGASIWFERYEEAVPKLDAALAEAVALAAPETRTALASTTGEAHRDLVTMERRSLALARGGDLAAARALLDGPEFSYLEDVYASGMDIFGQELASSTQAHTDSLTDRAWLEALVLALAVVVLVAAALWVRGAARVTRALTRVAEASSTDALTALPNRQGFHEAAASLMVEPASTDPALLLIGLDRFKSVNEAHGQAAGDEVLRLVVDRLRGTIREGDLLARLGGDEFALVLRRIQALAQPRREPHVVAARIVAAIAEPFVLGDGTRLQIGASVGMAVNDIAGTAVSDLVHQAGVALSRAKLDGGRCVRIFESGMDLEIRSRALLERDLRQAVAEDAILPHYQPLVDLKSGMLVGVEMLARWPHPARGMVQPDVFIALAEEIGVIGSLTERLLERACREAAGWPRPLGLACNLSPVQLCDPDLPGAIRDILIATGFPPARLELEVTESALVGDLELARASLGQLKALGVRLALDDFGTGYSSLRHLQALPFDKVKIDRSFVAAMAEDAESGKIVSAVVSLGHSLGLTTVAEGIETEEVAGLLRDLGCDVGQGWLYGRPVPSNQIAAMLADATIGRTATSSAA